MYIGNIKYIYIFRHFSIVVVLDGWVTSCKIPVGRLSQDFTDDVLVLGQVMAWCRHAMLTQIYVPTWGHKAIMS